MANFVLLYTGGSLPETQAQQAEVMQAWGVWFGQLGSALVDGGHPFTPVAKTVSKGGHVTDGSVGTPATGYSIIKADSLDAAIAIAKECPVFLTGSQLTVYETSPVM